MDHQNLTIAYIGGGSTNFGWRLMSELAVEPQIGGIIKLFDVEKQLALANEAIGNRLREDPANRSSFIYLAVDTLEEALKDADFVLLSFNQGTQEEIAADIHLPEQFGIYQAFGESAGPGGVARALRTLPVCLELADKIRRYCPEAWVINLTEPMTLCLEALYAGFPEIHAFGCSTEPLAAQELLAEMAAKAFETDHLHRRDIKTNLLGIYHCSWFSEASWNGRDLFPVFRDFAEQCAEEGWERQPGSYRSGPGCHANLVKFDLFLRYGMIAAAADPYIAEFCPPWYLKTPKTASAWRFSLNTPNAIKRARADRLSRSKRLMNGEESLKLNSSHFRTGSDIVLQIKALLGMNNILTNACLPNSGQITNLPVGPAVETNCLFSQGSVRPVMAGALPDEICGLIFPHIFNNRTLLQAVRDRDLDMAFNAFLNDPLMTLDLDGATELYKELLTSIRGSLLYYAEEL